MILNPPGGGALRARGIWLLTQPRSGAGMCLVTFFLFGDVHFSQQICRREIEGKIMLDKTCDVRLN